MAVGAEDMAAEDMTAVDMAAEDMAAEAANTAAEVLVAENTAIGKPPEMVVV